MGRRPKDWAQKQDNQDSSLPQVTELSFITEIKRQNNWRIPLGSARVICNELRANAEDLTKKRYAEIAMKVGLRGGHSVKAFQAELKRAFTKGHNGKTFSTLEDYYAAGRPCRSYVPVNGRGKGKK